MTTFFLTNRWFILTCGFEPVTVGRDLHADGFSPNYVSEHEEKYMAQGVPIKYGVFRMK